MASSKPWPTTSSPGSCASTNLATSAIDKFGADCLFQIISHHYERGATLVTTNRIYKHWASIFDKDAVLTSALLDRLLVQNLFHLDFVAKHANVVFISGTGLGKSHLMTALGHAACLRGHSVLFTGAIDIINSLAAAHAAGGIKRALNHYVKPQVLCIDELGYQRNRQVRRRLPVPDHQPPLRARRHAVDDEPDLQAMGQHLQR